MSRPPHARADLPSTAETLAQGIGAGGPGLSPRAAAARQAVAARRAVTGSTGPEGPA